MADSNKLISLNSILGYIRGYMDSDGNLKIESLSGTTGPAILSFRPHLETTSSRYARQSYIKVIPGSNIDQGAMLIQAGGPLIIGGGEYASNKWNSGTVTEGQETTRVGADSTVYIETNGQYYSSSYSNKYPNNIWTFGNLGDLTTPTGRYINYRYGQTVAFGNTAAFGYTSSTTNRLFFFIPVPIIPDLTQYSDLTITDVSLTGVYIAGVEGALCSNASISSSNATIAAQVRNKGLLLQLTISNYSFNHFVGMTPISMTAGALNFTIPDVPDPS